MSAYLTRAELDSYRNKPLSTSYPAEYLDALIEGVCGQVDGYCDKPFAAMDIIDREVQPWHESGNMVFYLEGAPIIALSGARWLWSFDHTGTDIDISSARIALNNYVYLPQVGQYTYAAVPVTALSDASDARVLVSYRAGFFEEVPLDVKLAVALLVDEQLQSDRNSNKNRPGPLQGFRSGSYSESYAINMLNKSDKLGLGTELSTRAKKFLANYRSSGLIILGGRH